ncbi:LysR substrate-binding domain-containing protein [Sphingomonas sp. dw_22]|uniref:LysR family transcriptional regulator n=1 Tax=Sphingomonas sp. dw_22 TaxID=2721175 RepID=UPI001BD6AEE6|nr:LysR substrate-binding domain-containing protein [Sphingomonas sp. dw_22]
MIDIRQLRYFVAVAETLHFGRAAERLHVTQPPLSRQVIALEKELGVRLLERHSRQARLTYAGERFLADSKAVLAAFDQACRNAQSAHAGELGELTIGFMMHAAYGSVPALTRRFIAARPQVRLHLREVLPTVLVDGVLNGEFDAGITFSPGPVRGLATAVIHREPLCLAVPADHALAAHKLVSAEMLVGEPLIAAPTQVTPTLRQAIADYLARAGGEPLIRLETQLQQTIVSLVAENIGIALIPQSLRKLGISGVKFRALADPPIVEQVLAWRTGNLNPALPHFLTAARAVASEIAGARERPSAGCERSPGQRARSRMPDGAAQ